MIKNHLFDLTVLNIICLSCTSFWELLQDPPSVLRHPQLGPSFAPAKEVQIVRFLRYIDSNLHSVR